MTRNSTTISSQVGTSQEPGGFSTDGLRQDAGSVPRAGRASIAAFNSRVFGKSRTDRTSLVESSSNAGRNTNAGAQSTSPPDPSRLAQSDPPSLLESSTEDSQFTHVDIAVNPDLQPHQAVNPDLQPHHGFRSHLGWPSHNAYPFAGPTPMPGGFYGVQPPPPPPNFWPGQYPQLDATGNPYLMHPPAPQYSQSGPPPFQGPYPGDAFQPVPSIPGVFNENRNLIPAPNFASVSDLAWQARIRPAQDGVTRQVKLTKGNFINEYPVPRAIEDSIDIKYCPKTNAVNCNEFNHLRYSAATVDPDDFTVAKGWSLRTKQYGRETEILIAITYYNEDKTLLARTLHGVMLNIRNICTSSSKFWKKSAEDGKPGWQRIVVALVFDGIDPCDKDVLDILATIGVYQDGIMKKEVDGKETVAHIFEYTTQLSVDTKPSLVKPTGKAKKDLVPVQMIFCWKQRNSKKINSHRWLFNAIGRQLEPEICVLLDAGTKPGVKSVFHLWKAFYNDPNLGGACGEIYAMLSHGKKLFNPIVAAQNFEYKMSNILDKPLESAFGYVSVLPGAFSAYRFRAIQGRPLDQYFHGDHTLSDRLGKNGAEGMNIFKKNMFLAEDRILCWELVAKEKEKWTLTYVKPAKAETDVPENAAEFISQRRRWLNGSFAASIYAMVHFYRLYRSGHSVWRLFWFHLQAIFSAVQLLFTWFALANLWLTFTIIIQMLPQNGTFLFFNEAVTHWANTVARWIYLSTLALQFILALGNRPKGAQKTYIACLIVFGLLLYYLLACSIILTYKAFSSVKFAEASSVLDKIKVIISGTNGVLLISMISTYGVYLLASILSADPWHMISSFLQYMALAPSFVNVLNTYAFCNLHDVSWGTKGSDKAQALPSVHSDKGSDGAVVEDVILTEEALEEQFNKVVQRATTKVKIVVEKELPSVDDCNRTFRTRLVSVWMASNAALVITVENLNGLRKTADEQSAIQALYFQIILWTTFGLSAVRFLGALVFWIHRQSTRCLRRQ